MDCLGADSVSLGRHQCASLARARSARPVARPLRQRVQPTTQKTWSFRALDGKGPDSLPDPFAGVLRGRRQCKSKHRTYHLVAVLLETVSRLQGSAVQGLGCGNTAFLDIFFSFAPDDAGPV